MNQKRTIIPLPFVIRNNTHTKSNLRFIYQRPPEFKHKSNILPFKSWKTFQQSIDDIVQQKTFWNRHKVMMMLLILIFVLFYIYHIITRIVFCNLNPNVCDLIQPGYCSQSNNNHEEECSQYLNWQIGYFVTNLILHFVTLLSMYKLQLFLVNGSNGIRITDDTSITSIHDICKEYSDSLFLSYGYFVEFDNGGNENGTQKIIFRSVVSDGEY